MALNKADGISQINNLFPDNTSGEISPADQRLVSTNAISSNLNLVDPGPQVATGSASLNAKQVGVNDLSHLPTPSGGVITLADNTRYVIGNDINFGTNRIVPGQNTVFEGIDENIITLTYTGVGNMFTGLDVSFRLKQLSIICTSGTFLVASDVAVLKTHFVVLDNVDVLSCDNLGTITAIRLFGIFRCNFANVINDGFDFVGDIEGLVTHYAICAIAAGTFLDFGTSTFDSIGIDSTDVTMASGSTAISGLSSSGNINSGGLGKIRFCRFMGAGAILSGITIDDALWNFISNDDIADSKPDGLMIIKANSTVTIITTLSTPVLVAGTWAEITISQFTSTAAGRMTYNGGRAVKLPVTVTTGVTVSSGTNQDIHFHLFLNGSILEDSETEANVDSGDTKNQTLAYQLTLNPGDFLELFVENNSTTNNITVVNSKFRIN